MDDDGKDAVVRGVWVRHCGLSALCIKQSKLTVYDSFITAWRSVGYLRSPDPKAVPRVQTPAAHSK